MTPAIQIAVDCHDPHLLARFWASAVGYEIEHNDEMIRGLIDGGLAGEDDVMEVDGHLQWRTAAACSDPDGRRPRLLFQQVPEPKAGKNRVHLDLHTFDDAGREAEVARLIELGATRLWDGQQGPITWVTMADPEGNEFCVS